MTPSNHVLRVLVVSTASVAAALLATDLMSAAAMATRTAHLVLGAIRA